MSIFLLHACLISIRLLPVLVVSPIVVLSRIPLSVRLILSLMLAAVLAAGTTRAPDVAFSLPVVLGEFGLGVVMAFGFHAAHAGIDMAGRLIDTQIGLSATGVFDPATSNVISIVADLLGLLFALLFVVLDLHHELLRAISGLLTVIPPGSIAEIVSPGMLTTVLMQQFVMAFMLLAPVILGLWLADMAFAILSRSMPQANIYFLALPLKLGFGACLLQLALPLLVERMPLLFAGVLRAVAAAGGL